MNVDIQPVILDFLSRRKSVGIPGLGKLFWSDNNPQSGTTSAEMIPPVVLLKFEPGDAPSADLLKYLTDKFSISDERAERWLVNWGTQARKKIEEQGKLYLRAIGTFIKDEKEGISFAMDAAVLDEKMHLPDFVLTPVDRAYAGAPPTSTEANEDKDSEKDFLWFLMNFIIPFLLILAIAALSFFIYKQLMTGPVQADLGPVTELEEQDPGVIAGDTPVADQDPQIEEDQNVVATDTAATTDEVYTPDEAAVPELDEPEVETSDTNTWIEEEVPIGQEEQRLDSFENKFCIIIVGSFVRPGNAQKMISKIEEMGLLVHTEPYGRFTRVGVKFDCYETDLYRRLFQLRGTFTEDAWILKYREDGQ